MNAAEHRIFEKHRHVRLRGLLQSGHCRTLETQSMCVVLRGQALRDLLHEPGERQPRYEQPRRVGARLVPPDLAQSLHIGPVPLLALPFLCV